MSRKGVRRTLSRVMFFFRKLVGRGKLGTSKNNLGNFLLLNPGFFFFCVSGPAQKAVSVPSFFWGDFYAPPPPFLNPRRISVGAFSELKMPKRGGQVRKCPKPGLF
jgi:hypothetical protein